MESPLRPAAEPDFRLIETFGYQPGQGIARGDLHLARMLASAKALGFACDRRLVEAQLAQIGGDVALRCRLTLGRKGDLELTTAPMPAPLSRMRFVISDVRLPSADPLLRHKTTRRGLYDQARAALPDGVEEALLLNERGEVCEGTISNIAITTAGGDQLTPPLSSGCLAGVFRQSLLETGQLREAVLTLADLEAAAQITLMNSLRGAAKAVWRD